MTLPMPMTATDAVALVQLRSLLDEARRASQRTGTPKKLIATVLLDAVNESALNIVATSLSLSVARNDNFDGLKSRVQTALGSAWNAVTTTWRDVNRLHQARNLAQHHGIRSDPDEMTAWTTATESFSNSLIKAAFGIQLADVRISNVIVDATLRERLQDAEQHLEEGRLASAAKAAFDTFDSASSRWQEQATQRSLLSGKPFFNEIADEKTFKYLERISTDGLQLSYHQVFGPSASDYIWFRELRRGHHEDLNRHEVERALSFVFWWIVDWQAVAEEFVDDRRKRQLQAQRLTRQDIGKVASIASVEVTQEVFKDYQPAGPVQRSRLVVSLQCKDVPANPEEFDAWSRHLARALRISNAINHASVDDAGTITLYLEDTDNSAREQASAAVTASLREAEIWLRSDVEARQAQAAALQFMQQSFREKVASLSIETPSWVASIDPGGPTDGYGGADCCIITVKEGVPASALIRELSSQHATERVFSLYEQVRVMPRLPAEQIVEMLKLADEAVQAEISASEAARATTTSELRDARALFGKLVE